MLKTTEEDGANFYFKIDISTIDAAPGTARVPKCREETTQFNFLGFWCNHVVLEQQEAKNMISLDWLPTIDFSRSSFWILGRFGSLAEKR